jgi:hypothetical protein
MNLERDLPHRKSGIESALLCDSPIEYQRGAFGLLEYSEGLEPAPVNVAIRNEAKYNLTPVQ